MASFDVEAAKKAGYSDDEIRQFLLGSSGAQDAKKAGYSDQEILDHFGLGAAAPAAVAPSLGETINREASIAGGGLMKGVAAAAALPSTLQSGADWLERKAAATLGLPAASPQEAQAARGSGPLGSVVTALDQPTMAQTQGVVNALGIAGPEPATAGERLLSAGAQGVGSALATPLGGGTLVNAVTGAASGLGAQGAQELFPDSSVAPLVGGLLGGTIGGGLVGDAANALKASSGVKTAQGALDEASGLAATAKSGVEDLQQQKAALTVQKQELALQSQKQMAAAQATHESAVGQIAQNIGSAETLQQSGESLQSAARNWLSKTFPQRKEQIWSPVDAAIPQTTPVELSAFKSALGDINSDAGVLEPLAAIMKPSLPKQLASTLGKVEEGQAEGLVAPTTWADARRLRTTLGDAMGNPMTTRDIGEQNLSHLYATLTADLRSAAASQGPDALAKFDAANAQTTQLFDIAQGPMTKLVASAKKSADDPAAESVASSLISGGKKGASDLAVLRQELPDATNDLAATAIRQGKWNDLAPEAKQQLVADSNLRSALDSSHANLDNVANAAAQAKQQLVSKIVDLNGDLVAAKGTASGVKGEADAAAKALAAAQEAKAKLAGRWTVPGHLGVLGGSYLGEHVAAPLINSLGLTVSEPTLGLAGAAVPFGLMLAKNPALRGAAVRSVLTPNMLSLSNGQGGK